MSSNEMVIKELEKIIEDIRHSAILNMNIDINSNGNLINYHNGDLLDTGTFIHTVTISYIHR